VLQFSPWCGDDSRTTALSDPTKLKHSLGIARWNYLISAALICDNVHLNEATTMLTTILIVVLILALIGALPSWGYSRGWGYGPGGGLGLILIIVLVLALTGHI
jgi:hypothetical protein